MSKAFTTDSDEEEDLPEAPAFPPGTRNYMTRLGAERLQAEAEQLTADRAHLTGDVADQARARVIERRLRYLRPRLEALEAINPLDQPKDRVSFGATVKMSDGQGAAETWRIVGLDEMDLDRGWISWMSPLASALLEKLVGDTIAFLGRRLTILQITYEEQ